MRSHLKWILALVLVSVLQSACLAERTDPGVEGPVRRPAPTPTTTPSPAATPTPSPEELKKRADAATMKAYAEYAKDKGKLGFSPNQALFDRVLMQVRSQHVDAPQDARLFAGVKEEVRLLLRAAQQDIARLDAMAPDPSLMGRVTSTYKGSVDGSLLYFAAIQGLLNGTDDPYSALLTPRDYKTLMEQLQSTAFGGIGIFIELNRDKEEQLTVVEPLEGTPAYAAGLMAGDEIVQIDGKPTQGMTLDMATANIRGPKGTTVVLTVRRAGVAGVKEYPIQRAEIKVQSVSSRMLNDNIGYVRLRIYGQDTGTETRAALSRLQEAGAKAIILDVRNNGGGFITAAIDVCSNFVGTDDVVTYVLDRSGQRTNYSAKPAPRVTLPMVLLVNQFSASASEITAGCLKDHKRATLVGVKTFGKGSVQQLYPLANGAALKLTIAHFFTPDGNKINKVSVLPEVDVPMEPKWVGRGEKDVQLQKAIEVLKQRIR